MTMTARGPKHHTRLFVQNFRARVVSVNHPVYNRFPVVRFVRGGLFDGPERLSFRNRNVTEKFGVIRYVAVRLRKFINGRCQSVSVVLSG
jgi:hypothetical protein